MKSTIRLFRSVPITKNETIKNESFVEKCIPEGFIFTDNIFANYSPTELEDLFKVAKKEVGLNATQMNSSFHKSWQKVRDADIVQLYLEQIIHYYTTYGFESLGIYNKDTVYIPQEKLEIPDIELDKIKLTVIKGVTKEELKKDLLTLLNSGLALKEETQKDVINVVLFVELTTKEIENIKNKEIKATLYDLLGIVPENPIEFLRYIVYKATDSSLLIKNKVTIETIAGKKNIDVLGLIRKYKTQYGLEKLASIFYRFKALWLAFRTNIGLKKEINQIGRLAKKFHKPMVEDYLNTVTAQINKGELHPIQLDVELEQVNIFRKIRLAYALKFRTTDCESILYKVRNGKGWVTDFDFKKTSVTDIALGRVIESIVKDVKKQVEGCNIYIPKGVNYALPSTEKQFTGMLPSGTSVKVKKDMVFGIHWKNVKDHQVDLDLALVSVDGKFGWDGMYRQDDGKILFSGDITDAPEGASELFYIKKQKKGIYLLTVNYYNFMEEHPVPTSIFVGSEEIKRISKNYTVDPNNIICSTETIIDKKQKVLGIAVVEEDECKFYFSEVNVGNSITSSNDDQVKQTREYLEAFYTNSIDLRDILEQAGALISETNEDVDIDLSLENLNKNSFIDLLLDK